MYLFIVFLDFYVPRFELEAVTKLHIVTRVRKHCVQDFSGLTAVLERNKAHLLKYQAYNFEVFCTILQYLLI